MVAASVDYPGCPRRSQNEAAQTGGCATGALVTDGRNTAVGDGDELGDRAGDRASRAGKWTTFTALAEDSYPVDPMELARTEVPGTVYEGRRFGEEELTVSG